MGTGSEYCGLLDNESYMENHSSSWNELGCIDTAGHPVSYVHFDSRQELLWAASDTGRITSYCNTADGEIPLWCRYSSFQAHNESILQMEVRDWGLLSLAPSRLRIHSKGGMPTATLSHEEMQDLLTFTFTDSQKSHLCIGGSNPSLFSYDVQANRMVSKVDCNQGTTIVKASKRHIICGGISGDITLRDPKSLRETLSLGQPHATISDIDYKGTLLVSCGFVKSGYADGTWHPDPSIRVFDLRMATRELMSLQPDLLPYLVKFHPLFPSLLIAVEQMGTLQLLDINSPTEYDRTTHTIFNDHQEQGRCITVFDMSSSSQILSCGDNLGYIHSWSTTDGHPVINNCSEPTCHPINSINMAAPIYAADGTPLTLTEESSFSECPMPECEDELFSSWPPPNYLVLLGAPPRNLHSNVQKALQYRDYIGHFANPGYTNVWDIYDPVDCDYVDPYSRNIAQYYKPNSNYINKEITNGARYGWQNPTLQKNTNSQITKINTALNQFKQMANKLTDGMSNNKTSPTSPPIPNGIVTNYKKVDDFRPWEEVDTSSYNQTLFRGLANDMKTYVIPYSYMNSIIQVLFFLVPKDFQLRSLLLCHSCDRRFCTSCELGFLFHMLGHVNISPTVPAQATNFMRTIRQISEARGMGLFENEDNFTSSNVFTKMITRHHNFIRLILPLLHNEAPQGSSAGRLDCPPKSPLAPVLISNASRDEEIRNNLSRLTLANKTSTPKPAATQKAPHFPVSLPNSSNVDHLMGLRLGKVITCSCGMKGIEIVPNPQFTLDACPMAPQCSTFESQLEFCLNSQPTSLSNPSFGTGFCKGCSRVQMIKFHTMVHTLPYVMTININTVPQELAVNENSGDDKKAESPIPLQKYNPVERIYLYKILYEQNGDLFRWVVKDEEDHELMKEAEEVHVYQITSVVCHFKEYKPNKKLQGRLASYIRTSEEMDSWYLFEDVSITKSNLSDALNQNNNNSNQTPVMLFYEHIDDESTLPLKPTTIGSVQQQQLDGPKGERLLLYGEGGLAPPGRPMSRESFLPLSVEELPQRNDFVSLDAEFVEFKWDSKDDKEEISYPTVLGLARVSVCRPSGEAFIDDYVAADDQVHNYLTQYSGIVNGDLDPNISVHNVTTLKDTYTKLRYLVDRGVKFVGHGLYNDFRIINMFVPKDQICDTVELFYRQKQRKFSLKFLSYHLLDSHIQQETHNSIEDAAVAMRLYQKYLELKKAGTLDSVITSLYEIGNRDNWMVPGEGCGPNSLPMSHVERVQYYQQRQSITTNLSTVSMTTTLNSNAKPFIPPNRKPTATSTSAASSSSYVPRDTTAAYSEPEKTEYSDNPMVPNNDGQVGRPTTLTQLYEQLQQEKMNVTSPYYRDYYYGGVYPQQQDYGYYDSYQQYPSYEH